MNPQRQHDWVHTAETTSLFKVEGQPLIRRRLNQVPEETGFELIHRLYSPDERFAEGFYRYKVDILKHPEKLAWDNTLEELSRYIDELKMNYHQDDCVHTVGMMQGEEYLPVGIFCMRPLHEHTRGNEILSAMAELGALERYPGSKAMVHTFSLLKDYRNLTMLKYIFVSIALDAIQQKVDHIFFFMSDYRLKNIYRRYGLEFPLDLKFRDSQHVVGCFPINEVNIERIQVFLKDEL